MKTAFIFLTAPAERAAWFTPGLTTTSSFQGGPFRMRVREVPAGSLEPGAWVGDVPAAEAQPVAGVIDPGSSGVTAAGYSDAGITDAGYTPGVLRIKWRRIEAAKQSPPAAS